jgi:photosystem II stability/assembly factor-like uncharacterized protein
MRTKLFAVLVVLFACLPGYSQNQWARTHAYHSMRVCMMDADTLFLYGHWGNISKSTDGGITWQYNNFPLFNDIIEMSFGDKVVGYFVTENYCASGCPVGLIYKTTNGGCTWNPVNRPALPANEGITSISFADAATGWAVTDKGNVYKTTNGSNTWSCQF